MSLFDEPAQTSAYPEAIDFKFEKPGDAVEGEIVELSERIDGQFGQFRFLYLKDGEKVYRVLAPVKTARSGKEYGVGASLERFNAAVGDLAGVKFEGVDPDRNFKKFDTRVKKVQSDSLFD